MQKLKKLLSTYGKTLAIGIFLILAFIAGNTTGFSQKKHAPTVQVLSANTHALPSPTISLIPTSVPVTIINTIIVPTQAPIVVIPTELSTPTIFPTTTPFPTQSPTILTPTPTISLQPTEIVASPSPTLLPTAIPTPISQIVEIDIDYGTVRSVSTYSTSITSGETAWQAVQNAIGITHIHYTDYGGSLGIFITGFNGVDASSNQYYDFRINGTSSSVGVSTYILVNHDVLQFVLTNF